MTPPFATETVWNAGLAGTGTAAADRSLTVGREGEWEPEHLLLLAAESSFMSTLLALAAQAGITVLGYVSSGHLDVTNDAEALPQVSLAPCVVVATPGDAERIAGLGRQAEQASIVARLLGDRLCVTLDVRSVPRDYVLTNMGTPRTTTLEEYYAGPRVRQRIREYCGASGDEAPTCVYLTAITGKEAHAATWGRAPRYPLSELERLMAAGADLTRSTWDTSSLLIHLDIDYQNSDFPGEAYYHPVDVLFKLEPVFRAVRHLLGRFDLPLLPLMTGQGYHFTGRVPLDSDVIDRLADLLPVPPRWLPGVCDRQPRWVTAAVTPRHARAYVGASMLVEFLAHLILRRAARRAALPIVLNGTVVGSRLVGRECISLDLSYGGDPMDVRHMRVAFGAYQKHRFRPDVAGHRVARERAPLVVVPRLNDSLTPMVWAGRDLRHAARAARSGSAVLPVVTEGVRRLLTAYRGSRLGQFHRSFYATPPRGDGERDDLFRSLPLSRFPPCIVRPLVAPHDRLLQPAFVQDVTRFLMAEGMKPRDIAAVVQSRYEADFGWGERWSWLDAATRAEFDVRVFAGLLASGLDGAVDFNCCSAQEKGLCPGGDCGHDLRVDRDRLLATVSA